MDRSSLLPCLWMFRACCCSCKASQLLREPQKPSHCSSCSSLFLRSGAGIGLCLRWAAPPVKPSARSCVAAAACVFPCMASPLVICLGVASQPQGAPPHPLFAWCTMLCILRGQTASRWIQTAAGQEVTPLFLRSCVPICTATGFEYLHAWEERAAIP